MANLWSGDYRPLRVVAHLASAVAVVPGEPLLPLDGILEYAASQINRWPCMPCATTQRLFQDKQKDCSRYVPGVDSANPANFLLPIKRFGHKIDPDWFWHASWGIFPHGFEYDRTHWNQRFDGAGPQMGEHLDFQGKRGTINITAGRYKSYHMPMCLLVAPCISWHCLGAVDGVTRLLHTITHLGHKRSQGFGEVSSWHVFAEAVDRSLFLADGAPARALPVSRFAGDNRRYVGLRAPYWHPSRRRECVTPVAPTPGISSSLSA